MNCKSCGALLEGENVYSSNAYCPNCGASVLDPVEEATNLVENPNTSVDELANYTPSSSETPNTYTPPAQNTYQQNNQPPAYNPPQYNNQGQFNGQGQFNNQPYPRSAETSKAALGSLIASILSFFILGLPLSIASIVLGVIGLNEVKNKGAKGKGLAIAGIIIGAIALLVVVISFIFIFLGIMSGL